ncbi:MAG: NAD(P)-binding protein, partial [Reyranella sp.]|nr:NAD(P)-binding protein [Reyranella sp.]
MAIAAEATRTSESVNIVEHWDVIVIGAGLSGMYQLLKLRQMGFKARVYEAGGGVGGTWYWNRYP